MAGFDVILISGLPPLKLQNTLVVCPELLCAILILELIFAGANRLVRDGINLPQKYFIRLSKVLKDCLRVGGRVVAGVVDGGIDGDSYNFIANPDGSAVGNAGGLSLFDVDGERGRTINFFRQSQFN